MAEKQWQCDGLIVMTLLLLPEKENKYQYYYDGINDTNGRYYLTYSITNYTLFLLVMMW